MPESLSAQHKTQGDSESISEKVKSESRFLLTHPIPAIRKPSLLILTHHIFLPRNKSVSTLYPGSREMGSVLQPVLLLCQALAALLPQHFVEVPMCWEHNQQTSDNLCLQNIAVLVHVSQAPPRYVLNYKSDQVGE